MLEKKDEKIFHDLDGAWEPKGYIGPRVEIKGNELVRFWMGAPVLKTEFTEEKQGEKTVLHLKKTALCYEGASSSYAMVKECYVQDGGMTFIDDFPITGESTDTLYPTPNSRYGNVTIVDEQALPLLQGTWKQTDYDANLRFFGNVASFGYGGSFRNKTKIVTVKNNWENGDRIYVINENPAKSDVCQFEGMYLEAGVLHAYIPVCDASPVMISFLKVEK
jgi:hypothetical protein